MATHALNPTLGPLGPLRLIRLVRLLWPLSLLWSAGAHAAPSTQPDFIAAGITADAASSATAPPADAPRGHRLAAFTRHSQVEPNFPSRLRGHALFYDARALRQAEPAVAHPPDARRLPDELDVRHEGQTWHQRQALPEGWTGRLAGLEAAQIGHAPAGQAPVLLVLSEAGPGQALWLAVFDGRGQRLLEMVRPAADWRLTERPDGFILWRGHQPERHYRLVP